MPIYYILHISGPRFGELLNYVGILSNLSVKVNEIFSPRTCVCHSNPSLRSQPCFLRYVRIEKLFGDHEMNTHSVS